MRGPFFIRACRWLLLAGWLVLRSQAHAQTPPAASPVLSFCAPRTVAWLGRTAVIPFRTTQPPAEDSVLAAFTADPSVVELIRPPALLSGESTGYLRVRALRAGTTRLTLQGQAVIDLVVKPDPAAAAYADIDVESARPRIISPMPDAAVWGQFAVGVEVFDAPEITENPIISKAYGPPPPPTAGTANPANEPTVRLRLPNGRLLEPVSHTGSESGPLRHYQFTVEASDFPPGSLRLAAVSSPGGFTDVDRRAGRGATLESAAVTLRNYRPERTDILSAGECESTEIMGITRDLYAPARPERFRTRQPDIQKDDAASGGRAVPANEGWTLPVVVREKGDYQLFIQARGNFAAGAFATACLYMESSEAPIGSVRLAGPKYQRLPVGRVLRLDAGPQMLTIAFRNTFGSQKESRTLLLDRYELVRVGDLPPAAAAADLKLASRQIAPPLQPPASSDFRLASVALPAAALPPRLNVLYPSSDAVVFGVDAVIGRWSAADAGVKRPAWVDVLIDGLPQGVQLASPAPAEPMVLPLLLRGVSPGVHRLGLRMADAAGVTTDSPTQPLTVLAEQPFTRGPYERAVFLLDRLAFGAEPNELAAVLTMGETAWLRDRLASGFDVPAEQAVLQMACKRYPNLFEATHATSRTLFGWSASPNPVRSRFTAWVDNHFSTWMTKAEPYDQWHAHLDFCRLGVAPFADLLGASAHSPAMLGYLDQVKSVANKLNENYAREIMELHTLGVHGGYTQTDVTALASVLNGWTATREAILPQEVPSPHLTLVGNMDSGIADEFRFAPVLSDGKGQRVFGMQFPAVDPAARYDRVKLALEMLSSHPSTAAHVCRQLAEHYISVPAPDDAVQAMTMAFHATGGDLAAVIRAMVDHPAFWRATPKMATPLDYALRIERLCRASLVQMGADPDQSPKPEQIEGFLKKSGMGVFDRVTPDGYPQNDDSYADSNALLQRWHFMESIPGPLSRLIPKSWCPVPGARMRPVGDDSNGPSVVTTEAAQRLIDLAAVRLTGRLLTPSSNQAALDLIAPLPPADQLPQALLFVGLLPETSLR